MGWRRSYGRQVARAAGRLRVGPLWGARPQWRGGGSVVGGSVAGPGVAAAYGSGVAGQAGWPAARLASGIGAAGCSAAELWPAGSCGGSAPRSAVRYSWVACHHAVCCLVRVASLVLGSEVVMPEKVRIAFAPLDIE